MKGTLMDAAIVAVAILIVMAVDRYTGSKLSTALAA